MSGYATPISADIVLKAKAMLDDGNNPSVVARVLGLQSQTVFNWVKRGWPKNVTGETSYRGRSRPIPQLPTEVKNLVEKYNNPDVSVADELEIAVSNLADSMVNIAARLEQSRNAISVLRALEAQFEEIRTLHHKVDTLEAKTEEYRQKLISGALGLSGR